MAEICAVCGLPGELCICQEIAKEQQRAIISTDRRRYGKLVTKVEESTTQPLTSTNWQRSSKRNVRESGTVKGRVIELQGEHKKTARSVLRKNGYNVEVR